MTTSKPQTIGAYPNTPGLEPRFLDADCLPPGRDFTVTITSASVETVEAPQDKGKKLLCLHFQETNKLLALNKTNAHTIATALGSPVVEDWYGKRITLFRDMVKAFGRTVPAVRVRPQAPGGSGG